jgi:hypothetical protein
MNLIKKILKKKVWDIVGKKGSDDWVCIKRGLIIYFSNSTLWTKDMYRMWRDNIPSDVRDEMLKEGPSELQNFISTYKK